MLGLHEHKSLTINLEALLKAISWKKSAAPSPGDDTTHPGLYLASALASCAEGEMLAMVQAYLASNPRADASARQWIPKPASPELAAADS